MLINLEQCLHLLRCPRTGSRLEQRGTVFRATETDGLDYSVAQGKPILIDFETSVVTERPVTADQAPSLVPRSITRSVAVRFKTLISPNPAITRRNITRLLEMLRRNKGRRPRVLVVGGGSVGQGANELYEAADVDTIAFDIYASPMVQFVADAHRIPLVSGSVDAVLVQAVLEHVLEPAKVVAEIWRVLGPDGVVYAETPFMQQVHEGPYDFTRFTESGHRWLFRDFTRTDSGVVLGPGSQLIWSLDYFARGVFRSRLAGRLARVAFCWVRLVDLFIPLAHQVDGACGVYFLGTKSAQPMSVREIVVHYRGAG